MPRSPDVVVVGAGVFGAWTAYRLRRTGRSVMLLDAFGPGNSRASSGGESRVIRVGYGDKAVYSRWALESIAQWQALFHEARRPLFIKTGVLFLGYDDDPLADETVATLQQLGATFELLGRDDLERRYPQFRLGAIVRGILEPDSGVILARRAVDSVVRRAVELGVDYRLAAATQPAGSHRLVTLELSDGTDVSADTFVFACGPWLAKLFPDLLAPVLHTTRQEVFFFGGEPGDRRLVAPTLPAWIDFRGGVYGLPDVEGRGVKIGLDTHGPPFDPDAGERLPSAAALAAARRLAGERIPDLLEAPLLDARVCQYTNTPNGDFLIDRHPGYDNVWLVGGGSGHGFKHGPAVGAYVAALMDGGHAEPQFELVTKPRARAREVF